MSNRLTINWGGIDNLTGNTETTEAEIEQLQNLMREYVQARGYEITDETPIDTRLINADARWYGETEDGEPLEYGEDMYDLRQAAWEYAIGHGQPVARVARLDASGYEAHTLTRFGPTNGYDAAHLVDADGNLIAYVLEPEAREGNPRSWDGREEEFRAAILSLFAADVAQGHEHRVIVLDPARDGQQTLAETVAPDED